MSEQHTLDPFGYFRAEPFGWTDCAETDDGAQPLFDQAAIDAVAKQRDELLAAIGVAQATMNCAGIDTPGIVARTVEKYADAIASVKSQPS